MTASSHAEDRALTGPRGEEAFTLCGSRRGQGQHLAGVPWRWAPRPRDRGRMNGAVPLTPAQETRPIPLVAKARQNAWPEPIRPGGAAAQVLRRLGRTVPTVPVLRGEAFCRALRARHLDPSTTAFPTRHPAATALHLGCGLDGQVDRVRPSLQVRGFDLDLPGGTALRRMVDPRTEGPGHRWTGAPVTGGLGRTQRPTDRPTRRGAAGLLTDLLEADVRALATRLSGPLAPGERRFDARRPLGTRLGAWPPALQASGAQLRWGLRGSRQGRAWAPHPTRLEHVGLLDRPGFARLRPLERLAWRAVRRIPTLRAVHPLLRYRRPATCPRSSACINKGPQGAPAPATNDGTDQR